MRMIAVYKYDAPIMDDLTVIMPLHADVLTVQMQGDDPCIWARVNTAHAPIVARRFRWAGTGHALEGQADWSYVGTVQLMGGSLVFHLFAEPMP